MILIMILFMIFISYFNSWLEYKDKLDEWW